MKAKTKFTVRGDASIWEVISYDSATEVIQGRNMTNGFVGPIAKATVVRIFEVAKSVIPSEDIKIVEKSEELPTYGKIKKDKRKSRKKK